MGYVSEVSKSVLVANLPEASNVSVKFTYNFYTRDENIINGAKKAKDMKLPLITLSGFLEDNPLRSMGDINLWVDSKNYNVIETTHQIWLLSAVDYIIENSLQKE